MLEFFRFINIVSQPQNLIDSFLHILLWYILKIYLLKYFLKGRLFRWFIKICLLLLSLLSWRYLNVLFSKGSWTEIHGKRSLILLLIAIVNLQMLLSVEIIEILTAHCFLGLKVFLWALLRVQWLLIGWRWYF